MHRLNVSGDVLSGIRARRQGGEETEDQVLRRLLDLPAAPTTPKPGDETGGPGFRDATYGIHFPEGFEISRTYKGRPFTARVSGGRWLLDADGRLYDSFNQLSQAVIDGNENAWMFWFFGGPAGTKRRISELRDPARVQKRPRRNAPRTRSGPLPRTPAVLKLEPPPAAPAAALAPGTRQTPTVRPAPAPAAESPSPSLGPSPGPGPAGGMAWEPATKTRQG
ncbi:MAG: hypothetical protein IIC06_09585 [Proteobacteria bacterium]|nr:hypothetical protein [Pseudomonadota bacterium]